MDATKTDGTPAGQTNGPAAAHRQDGPLTFEIRGRTGWITLDRPDAMNALTLPMYERLAEICEAIARDGDIRCLVIVGAGERAFAAGTDIATFRTVTDAAAVLGYEALMERVFRAIEACPVPVIAAMAGAATGGGAAIACAADIRLAAQNLRFGFPIARTLGNALSVENLARVGELVGLSRLRELMLTARLIGAEEAQAISLVSRVVADRPALLAAAEEMAAGIADLAPITLSATKEALRRLRRDGAGAGDRDLLLEAYLSEDFRDAVAAFAEKRRPVFKGR
ncbi:enoyl-CoA hydratase [Aurantimonas sp. 22II-16-19i]|uniref:enoyl-CoA hydratase n=1 Tax=Aurantimonas sp. 22II-16-19i TaxID=1317114 RepID=UPI0009F7C4E2|nr:enoyl-CoA hydratase [Aurantimonas sp. 22II-16-19i]ORE92846.1 enoyl-CoA hydratase [Aurantimonas sp. 22II-16-19i]